MVESTIKRFPTAQDLGSWGYAKSLYLYGSYLVWRRTGDKRYLQYLIDWVDSHVDSEGNFFNTNNEGKRTEIRITNLDSMYPGNLVLIAYKETKQTEVQACGRENQEAIRHLQENQRWRLLACGEQESGMAIVG